MDVMEIDIRKITKIETTDSTVLVVEEQHNRVKVILLISATAGISSPANAANMFITDRGIEQDNEHCDSLCLLALKCFYCKV